MIRKKTKYLSAVNILLQQAPWPISIHKPRGLASCAEKEHWTEPSSLMGFLEDTLTYVVPSCYQNHEKRWLKTQFPHRLGSYFYY